MAAPTVTELKAIQLFEKRMEDVLSSEQLEDKFFLLRWIRAREMNLDKAEIMLKNAINWRAENNVDNVLEKKIDQYFYDNYPRWVDGVDKEGRPLYCASIGKWDLRTVVRDGRSEEFIEYTTEGFERLIKAIRESNESRELISPSSDQLPITQIVAIFDFEGFAFGQLINYKAVQNFLALGNLYEAYYPEILHQCFFVNCPVLISAVLALIKPILAPKTMAKIKVFGSNKSEWQEEVLKVINADQLLPSFGGTRIIINK